MILKRLRKNYMRILAGQSTEYCDARSEQDTITKFQQSSCFCPETCTLKNALKISFDISLVNIFKTSVFAISRYINESSASRN